MVLSEGLAGDKRAAPNPLIRNRTTGSTLTSEGVIVVVVGGRGGCGATSLVVALAAAAVKEGHSAVVVDADPGNDGLAQALGIPAEEGLRWSDFAHVTEQLPGGAIAEQLPDSDGIALLTGNTGLADIDHSAREFTLAACARAFEIVVVDVPRYELLDSLTPGTGPARSGWIGSGTVVVPITTLEVGSLRLTAALTSGPLSPRCPVVVVRGDRGPVPVQVAQRLLSPTLLLLKNSRGLNGAADFGDLRSSALRGPIGRVALRIVTELLHPPDLSNGAGRYPAGVQGETKPGAGNHSSDRAWGGAQGKVAREGDGWKARGVPVFGGSS